MFRLLALACLLAGTEAVVVQLGTCPTVTTQNFFNQFFMRGTWFEIRRYFFIEEGLSSCNTWEWENNLDRSVTITFSGVAIGGDELLNSITFETDSNDRAILDFNEGLFRQLELKVIDTDYMDYAVIYSCDEAPAVGANAKTAWLLSRRPGGFSARDQANIQRALAENGIDESLFFDVDQSDCPNRR